MKRSCAVTWALMLFTIVLPLSAGAVPQPSHFGLAIGIKCMTCHQTHKTLGVSKGDYLVSVPEPGISTPRPRNSPAVYNNMC